MSASREKKKRQELLAGGVTDPKAAKAAEEKAAARKTNILYGTLGLVFVVVALFLVIYNSSFITRSRTAVTIDGEKYSVAETSYYYGQTYQSYLSSTEGYMMMMYGMIDTSQPLGSQAYPYDSSMTWADYFKSQAVQTMRFVHAANKAAAEDNVVLESEDLENFDSSVSSMKDAAASAGVSYAKYLSQVYGPNITASVYESCLKEQLLASKYAARYQDSLEFTEDEIEAYYVENKNSYDLVDGGFVSISATPETLQDAEGNSVEPTEEETAAALQAAQDAAQRILNAYLAGSDSLEALAEKEDNATYTGGARMTYSTGDAYTWLFSEDRKDGDTEIITSEDSSRVYVLVFNSRQRIEFPEYDVRHILVTSDNLDLAEDEEATDEQIEAKAQEILDSWDGTEDGFAELAKEYSQDGNAADGGLYEDVYWGQMVSAFNDWCYEDGRKAGDTGIVQTSYGYHIMYFVGYGDEAYWHYSCNNALVSDAYSDWFSSMTESATADVNDGAMGVI